MLSARARRLAAAVVLAGAVGAGALALFGSPVGASPDGKSPAHETYTSPQPQSNADDSGHGANTHGPYDSTRDGSPAQNGNGGGNANGKPCAGCVGKADNKNPPGQMPGGSDGNAGYECDRNNGIGKSNPAHTGCTDAVTPPTTPTSPGTSVPSAGTPASSAPGTAPPSSAAPGSSTPSSSTPSSDGDAPAGTPPTSPAPAEPAAGIAAAADGPAADSTDAPLAAATRLPNTGTPTASLLLTAGIFLVAGAAVLALASLRRRKSAN